MIKAAILKNEDPYDHEPWIKACDRLKGIVDFKVIDFSAEDWLESIEEFRPDILLTKPAGKTSLFREQYIERFSIIDQYWALPAIPTFKEAQLYENKKYLSYWLKINKVPHPKTWVFYSKKQAINFANHSVYPFVAKINIGASGRGVVIIKSREQAIDYIERAFSVGIRASVGPRLSQGKILSRVFKKILQPQSLLNRLKTYHEVSLDKQLGYVIFQEYIPHDYEWRIVVIGDSYFAHKKLKKGEKASGSLLKNYDNPPLYLFDFAKSLITRFGFTSQAIDAFETSDGRLLINEMQCIFGQSDPYQMLVDGIPGRYRFIDDKWQFEPGDFARNGCYDLRLEYLLSRVKKK